MALFTILGSRGPQILQEAEHADAVIEAARSQGIHPWMVVRLVERGPHGQSEPPFAVPLEARGPSVRCFRPLHRLPNEPPPPSLRGRTLGALFEDLRPGRTREVNHLVAHRFYGAIRDGQIEGKSGIIGPRAETRSVLEFVRQHLRQSLLPLLTPALCARGAIRPLDDLSSDGLCSEAELHFRQMPEVELDLNRPPDEPLLTLLCTVDRKRSPSWADYTGDKLYFPWAVDDRGLYVLPRVPFPGLLAPLLAERFQLPIHLLRCAKSPVAHAGRVTRYLELIGALQPEAAMDWHVDTLDDRLAESAFGRGTRQHPALPRFPAPTRRFGASRFLSCLAHGIGDAFDLAGAPPSATAQRMTALKQLCEFAGGSGLSAYVVRHNRLTRSVELCHPDRLVALKCISLYPLDELAVPLLALLLGISPTELPPARGSTTADSALGPLTLHGTLHNTPVGESLWLEWEAPGAVHKTL